MLFKSGILPIVTRCDWDEITPATAVYHLHYVDPRGKFDHADRIECSSDSDAVDAAYDRHLPVRCELRRDGRLVAKLPPNRRIVEDMLRV
jgi:hypothetical protein